MNLFSQRRAGPPDRYSYIIPEKVRWRIIHTLQQHKEGWMGGRPYDFISLLDEVRQQLLARFGNLRAPAYVAAQMSDHAVVNHFFACSDEEALEFIELCFQADTMGGDSQGSRKAVAAFNRILEEEGIGYELTLPATIDVGPGALLGRTSRGMRAIRTEFPKVIRKDERTVHEKAVKPALEVL
jgi:hypothetical protein